jgi:putative oxidoreductase
MDEKFVERFAPLAGRILIGGVYIVNALGLIGAFAPVTGLMAVKGLPFPALLLAVTIAAWLIGGGCVVLGYRVRPAGLMLAAITVPVTLCIHAPWSADPAAFQNELNHFLKNLAIIGGLLYVAGSRPGAFSLERGRDETHLTLASARTSR